VLDLLHLDDLVLVEYLDGVKTTIVTGPNEMNTAKGSGTQTNTLAQH